jgi:1-acyl-sn-glycerol-3-phosphate acyltransferase
MAARSRYSPWLYSFIKPIHWILIRFYFRVKIVNIDRFPTSGPVIVTPTHRSKWDGFFVTQMVLAVLKKPPHYLVNEGNFRGLQGWILSRMGCVSINLFRPSHEALRHCRDLIESGTPLVIFPEATIYYYPPNHVHAPLAAGAAWMAMSVAKEGTEGQPKILPVRLNYSRIKLGFGAKIEVVLEDPIDMSAYSELSKKEARNAITSDLQRRLGDVENPSKVEEFPATEFLKSIGRKTRNHEA